MSYRRKVIEIISCVFEVIYGNDYLELLNKNLKAEDKNNQYQNQKYFSIKLIIILTGESGFIKISAVILLCI